MIERELNEHEQAFYNDGYRLGEQAAKVRNDEKKFLSYVRQMHKSIDQLIDMLEQHALKQGVSIDCKKGCGYCCHQAVFATSYELHLINDFIKRKISSANRQKILELATLKSEKTENLSEKDILNYKEACPLLVNNACSIHPARPMACRIYLSMKLETCIKFFNEPEKEDSIPALMEFLLNAGRMMNEGFTSALNKGGIEIAELRLESGLKTMLIHGVQ